MENYEFCVLKNENDIIEYEKGLFKAYKENDLDGWIYKNYQKIDNNRLRAFIPYNDQEIYALRNKTTKKIIAGAGINYNTEKELQLEKMGFKRISRDQEKFCEGLNFYIENNIDDFLELLSVFFEKVIRAAIDKKIYICYGTCSKKIKSIYTLTGWEILETKNIDGVDKCLLKYNAHIQDGV